MSYFDREFLTFFEELAKNNDKSWFDANRKRYETVVRDPFSDFIAEMIARISVVDHDVSIAPKEAIMRINRDTRFSKDKTPYKTWVSAIISPGGKKDKSTPGSYIQLDAEAIRYYGGAHMLDKDQLLGIRRAISADLSGFQKLIEDPEFVKAFEKLDGDQHKRIPPEFREAAEQQPLLANKQFYYFAKLDAKHVLDADLPEQLMRFFEAGRKMNAFLRKAMR